MKREEPIKTFMMIWNLKKKKILSIVHKKILQRRLSGGLNQRFEG